MYQTLKITIITILLFAFTGSCRKDPNTTSINGVYVAGFEFNAQGKRVAKYWKDGVPTNLSNGATNAEATSIYCTDKEVVVAGFEKSSSTSAKDVATYWKNGKSVRLTDGSIDCSANSIFVSGTDVYVAGNLGPFGLMYANIWKNGISNPISEYAGSSTSEALSLYGNPGTNEIWVAGSYYDGGIFCCGETHPAVWLGEGNASAIKLGDGLGLENTKLGTAIFYPEKGQQYVAGNIYNTNQKSIAVYWHNLIMTKLTDGSQNAYAKSIFVKI